MKISVPSLFLFGIIFVCGASWLGRYAKTTDVMIIAGALLSSGITLMAVATAAIIDKK